MTSPITQEEVKHAIMSWPSNKAPGLDGFCGEFYKTFKNDLLPDITEVLSRAMACQGNLYPLNNSITMLIPKKENASNLKDFRPISLINGIQKIMSKVLATRLQGRIDSILHKAQTGFVQGRQIT